MAVSRETSWNWADALSNQEHASVEKYGDTKGDLW
jgi:hypothetical protein